MLEINVTRFKEPRENLLGLASFRYNEQFFVQNIRIMESKEGEIFLSMPSYKKGKTEDGKDDYRQYVNPVTKDFREELYSAVLNQYWEGGGRTTLGALGNNEPNIAFDGYFNPYTKDGSEIRGLVKVVIDGKFSVNGIGVYQGRDKDQDQFIISMPSYKTNEVDEKGKPVYKKICYPRESKFANALYKMINDIAKQNEKVHFNEKGVIPAAEEKNNSDSRMAAQNAPEDDFLSIPEEMMQQLPFVDEALPSDDMKDRKAETAAGPKAAKQAKKQKR